MLSISVFILFLSFLSTPISRAEVDRQRRHFHRRAMVVPASLTQCAHDLVGDPKRFDIPELKSTDEESYFQKRLGPLLIQHLKAEGTYHQTVIENSARLTHELGQSQDIRNLAAGSLLISLFVDHPEIFQLSSDGLTYELDTKAWAALFDGVAENEMKALGEAAKILRNTPELGRFLDEHVNDYDYLIRVKTIDFVTQSQDYSNWITAQVSMFGSNSDLRQFEKILNKINEHAALSLAEKADFVYFFKRYSLSNEILNGKTGTLLSRSHLSLAVLVQGLAISTKIRLNQSLVYPQLLKGYLGQTKDIFAHMPNRKQLFASAEMAERIRSSSVSALPLYFNSKESEIARLKLQVVHFDYPVSREDAREVFIEQLQKSLVYLSEETNRIRHGTLAEKKGAFSNFIFDISAMDSSLCVVSGGCFPVLQKVLGNWGVSFSDDQLDMYLENEVYVGWQSVQWPDAVGVPTLAHELGHAVSEAIPDHSPAIGKAKALACSHENHASVGDRKQDHEVYGRFDEEDWADIFSVSVSKSLKSEGVPVVGTLIQTLSLNDQNSGLPLYADLVSVDFNESHSGALLRELLFDLGIGIAVPLSCSELVRSLKDCAL